MKGYRHQSLPHPLVVPLWKMKHTGYLRHNQVNHGKLLRLPMRSNLVEYHLKHSPRYGRYIMQLPLRLCMPLFSLIALDQIHPCCVIWELMNNCYGTRELSHYFLPKFYLLQKRKRAPEDSSKCSFFYRKWWHRKYLMKFPSGFLEDLKELVKEVRTP